MLDTEINPLNVLEARRLEYLPPHMIPLPVTANSWYSENVPRWIEANLKGRYFFGVLTRLVDNSIISYHAVAFEDPAESTMFFLKCPLIGQK
jgi:hypothetical protein